MHFPDISLISDPVVMEVLFNSNCVVAQIWMNPRALYHNKPQNFTISYKHLHSICIPSNKEGLSLESAYIKEDPLWMSSLYRWFTLAVLLVFQEFNLLMLMSYSYLLCFPKILRSKFQCRLFTSTIFLGFTLTKQKIEPTHTLFRVLTYCFKWTESLLPKIIQISLALQSSRT
jgi:hypothetical protein